MVSEYKILKVLTLCQELIDKGNDSGLYKDTIIQYKEYLKKIEYGKSKDIDIDESDIDMELLLLEQEFNTR